MTKEEIMDLTEELDRLVKEPARDEDAIHDRIFWRLVDICLEMAKRLDILWEHEQEMQAIIRIKLGLPPDDQG